MELITSLRRFVQWHRRLLAAVLAGVAVLVIVAQLTPPASPGQTVVVTARAVGAGETIGRGDVRIAHLPSDAIPDAVVADVDDVTGQSLSVRLEANTVVQPGMLTAHHLAEPGRSLVPITLIDEHLVQMAPAGSAVTLVHISESGFEVLTADARTVALPPAPPGPSLAVGGGQTPMTLVDVPSQVAAAVAVLGQRGELSIVLGGG